MSEPAGAPSSHGERFQNFTKRSLVIVIVLFVANLATSVTAIVTAAKAIRQQTVDWRLVEYRKLQDLRAGQTLDFFKSKLGTPVYQPGETLGVRANVAGSRIIFHPRPEYWVEVVVDPKGAVVVYTVTSCSDGFRPTLHVRGGDEPSWPVTLNQTPMSKVVQRDGARAEIKVRTLIPATGNTFIMSAAEQARRYLGGRYRDFAWGVNNSCPMKSVPLGRDLEAGWGSWQQTAPGTAETDFFPVVALSELNAKGREMLASTVVNTYMETALNHSLDTYYPGLAGIDRYLLL
ncbi:ETEC_3214 domain-containing protein [Streptomyces sp. NPDC001523]|uniref:ETEC_3214 domain-containing protein n=1 Tax=Streptomyces sp. NPDC001523 TaxID=3154383 RepID=UPI003328AB60